MFRVTKAAVVAALLTAVTAFGADASVPSAPGAATTAALQVAGHTEFDATLRNGFTIHYVRKETLDVSNTRLFTGQGNNFVDVTNADITNTEQVFVPDPPLVPAQRSVSELVNAAAQKHQIDADFINSVIHAESGFNPHAVSNKGARGLMQLMPDTATQLGVKNAFDPESNIDGGTRYLRDLLVLYHGDAVKALAAYNAGSHRVEQYHGVPPYRETRAYVARIVREYNQKKTLATAKTPKRSHVKAASNSASSSAGASQ